MRTSIPAAALVVFLHAAVPAQTPKIPAGPWKEIFNKKDLAGWSSVGNPPWTIANGVLQTKGGATKTYLIWNEPLKDMELEVKYRLSTGNANSGIQVRSNCADKSKTLPTCGGTYQVCGVQLDVANSYSGRLFEECVGFLQFDGQHIDDCRRTLAVGQWTTTHARFDGAKVSVWLNGTHCLDYTLTNAEHLSGSVFALQSHPPFDLIEWESVKIRKLNVKGCTNPKATNFNAEATLDDGSCVIPSGLARKEPIGAEGKGARMGAIGPGAGRKVAVSVSASTRAATVEFGLQESGPYAVRLLDVFGRETSRTQGMAPVSGVMALPGHGIWFVEIRAGGVLTRHRLHRF